MSVAPPTETPTRGALSHWLANRNARFLVTRGASLVRRYGLGSGRGRRRVLRSVEDLGERGCRPTYPTPGRTVERHPDFFRTLSERGVELAVHSYDHVDFRAIPTAEALAQLERAAALFDRLGIPFDGFRCPYLGYTDELLAAVPQGLFRYSSNRSILWQHSLAAPDEGAGALYESLTRFYRGSPASTAVSLPRDCGNLIEIPLSVPDDLQLADGLGLGVEGVTRAWRECFDQAHERGELFAPLCHPEAYDRCAAAFRALLDHASSLRPGVWVAQLREIARWWEDRAAFSVRVEQDGRARILRFGLPPRGVVLARGLPAEAPTREWDATLRALESSTVELPPDSPLPFVGVAADVGDRIVAFLREAGYVVEHGRSAGECAVLLERETTDGLDGERALLDWLERAPGPLVRLAPWPDGLRSAFCVAGDLDALGLLDYAARMVRLGVGERRSRKSTSTRG